MGVECALLVGGRSVRDDIARLEARPHVVLGTPGRVLSMINGNRQLGQLISALFLPRSIPAMAPDSQSQVGWGCRRWTRANASA